MRPGRSPLLPTTGSFFGIALLASITIRAAAGGFSARETQQATNLIHEGVSQCVLTWIVAIISHFFIAVAELQRAPRLSHSGYRANIWSYSSFAVVVFPASS